MSHSTELERKELGCDFCKSNKPKWIYPTDTFTQVMLPGELIEKEYEMTGSWLACRTCHNIIERKTPRELIEHSLKSYGIYKGSKVYKKAFERIDALHAEFFFYRKGPAFKANRKYVNIT